MRTNWKGARVVAYGMSFKAMNDMAIRLAEKLPVSVAEIEGALQEITREQVLEIAANRPRGEEE